MTRVQYVGTAHFRVISSKDLANIGFEDQPKIELAREDVDPSQNTKNLASVAEVSDGVAAWLLKNEKGDWKELGPEEAPAADADPDALKVGPDGNLPEPITAPSGDAAPDAGAGSAGTPSAKSGKR